MRVLIGHTGFVGSNLHRQRSWDALVNSRNSGDLAGMTADLVVCAGVYAEKWRANADPAADLAQIDAFSGMLAQLRAQRFVLISTVDVYPTGQAQDESESPAPTADSPYGYHRHLLELRIRDLFEKAHVLRLPALYGPGLKKNALFDMMTRHRLEFINPAARFQWYGLDRIAADVDVAIANELEVVNLMTEPFATQAIADRFFPDVTLQEKEGPTPSYDVGTRHAKLFGGQGRYVQSSDAALDGIGKFLEADKAR